MTNNQTKQLSSDQTEALFHILEKRFTSNMHRHPNLTWDHVQARLENNPEKLWSLQQMELTGGEPDVVAYDEKTGEYIFFDCSAESPKHRRSICYDEVALASRKENKPKNSALGMAAELGIAILNEDQYRFLQTLEKVDTKTSSWIETPDKIRALGGALFGDYRYDTVFIYHNGAESYYAARGFRATLKI